jgi:hypothetical protein
MSDHPQTLPARPPTQEEALQESEQAFGVAQELVNAINAVRADMWVVAHWCYEADEQVVWLKLGYETKGEWLAQPEIHMTRGTFDRMVRVYRETVVARRLDAPTLEHLDPSKVDIVLAKVNKREVTFKQAISDVESLGAQDLREKYQGIKPRPPEPDPDETEVFDDEVLDEHEPAEPDDDETLYDADGTLDEDDEADEVSPRPERADAQGDVTLELARVMRRVFEELAPPEKKRMGADLRDEITQVMQLAIEAGLFDG